MNEHAVIPFLQELAALLEKHDYELEFGVEARDSDGKDESYLRVARGGIDVHTFSTGDWTATIDVSLLEETLHELSRPSSQDILRKVVGCLVFGGHNQDITNAGLDAEGVMTLKYGGRDWMISTAIKEIEE